jgi:hypothetical protein
VAGVGQKVVLVVEVSPSQRNLVRLTLQHFVYDPIGVGHRL